MTTALVEQFALLASDGPAWLEPIRRRAIERFQQHGVPTPITLFPRSLEDVKSFLPRITFPVMLKGIFGNRLETRTRKKMVIVHSPEELIEIANKEFAWCEAEYQKAAADLGYGDDWRRALEHVKKLHVGPGEQPS